MIRVAIAALAALVGCRGDSDAQRGTRLELREPPANLPPLPAIDHRSTRLGIELGRRLFFDPRLSANDRVSCATCHEPARAFTDGVARSRAGITGVALARNTPGLANVAWAPALFWDGGSKNLESLVMGPVQHPDEMGERIETMIGQLAADPELRRDFERAFPREREPVSPSTVMRALGQYMRSLISADSRYDRHVRGEPDGTLDEAELRGLEIYRARCRRCHATDLFTDHGFHDIGLDPPGELDKEDPRRGRARVSFRGADEHAYRTPTLRNLSYTGPYMHDGRFATLDQVLEHYRRGVHQAPSLDPLLLGADGTLGIGLTDAEQRDVIAFLRTLDDPAFIARHAAR